MTLNMEDQAGDLQSRTGEAIENVEDFIYLGSWIDGTERDIKVRKAKAWAALHRLQNIWKSKLSKSLKVRLFIAACESVLLYGSETWTLHDKGSREKFGWDIYQEATHGAGCHMEGQDQQCCPVRQVTKAEGFQTISELAQT